MAHATQEEKQCHHHLTQNLSDFRLGQRLIAKNPTCCDCNASNPKWAVTSHGVFVCIKCAAIHRTLRYVCKVHNIETDKWSNQMVKDFFKCGEHKGDNKLFNIEWEYYVNSKETDHYKPLTNSNRESRGNYITNKYYNKLFHKSNNSNKSPNPPLFDPNPHILASPTSSQIIKSNINNTNNTHNTHTNTNTHNTNNGTTNNSQSNHIDDSKMDIEDKVASQLKPTGTLKLFFMNARNLPRADPGLFGTKIGGKADPYVYCYQMDPLEILKLKQTKGYDLKKLSTMEALKGEPSEEEKEKHCTQVREHKLSPGWMTEEDKKRIEQGLNPVDRPDCRVIKMSVIEELPVRVEIWDFDKLSNDDLMGFCEFNVLVDCHPPFQEHFITKELKIAKEFSKQKRYTKKGKIPTVSFHATYNKLF